jgi:hypothetical protein
MLCTNLNSVNVLSAQSILFEHQSRAFLNVVFEWLGRVVTEIGLQRDILHFDNWEEETTILRRGVDWNWNLFSCKMTDMSIKLGIPISHETDP